MAKQLEPITVNEFITPARAEKYLSGNTHNRPLSQAIVTKWASVIKRGKWLHTHQGIGFDWNDVLTDGQHRLYAIWSVGQEDPSFKGVKMSVTRNLDPQTQEVVDQHFLRRADHVLSLKYGRHVSPTHIAIAKAMSGGLAGRKWALKDIQAIDDFVSKHFDAIEFAQNCLAKNKRGITAAAVKAVIARAFYHVNHETLRSFANVLFTGLMQTGDEAAIALRNYLMESTNYSAGSFAVSQLVYARTERALEAFVNRKPLKVKPQPTKSELYPLEDEIKLAVQVEIKKQKTKKNDSAPKARLIKKAVA